MKAEITLLKQELKTLREKTVRCILYSSFTINPIFQSVKEEDSTFQRLEETVENRAEESVQDIQQESELEQRKPKVNLECLVVLFDCVCC